MLLVNKVMDAVAAKIGRANLVPPGHIEKRGFPSMYSNSEKTDAVKIVVFPRSKTKISGSGNQPCYEVCIGIGVETKITDDSVKESLRKLTGDIVSLFMEESLEGCPKTIRACEPLTLSYYNECLQKIRQFVSEIILTFNVPELTDENAR